MELINPKVPTVTVIIPCRNEEKYMAGVIADFLQQDYQQNKLSAIFVDGNSTDKTAEIIQLYAASNSNIHYLKNPRGVVPISMNMGIQEAKSEIIMRWDAHASFPPNYVSTLIKWLLKLNADNVGGRWITTPSFPSAKARAIANVLSHPIGVGNSLFRIGVAEPQEVDTVPFGCYRKQTLLDAGLYDERLVRNQDIELNKRLKAMGGKIFLVPEVYSIYYARDTFSKLSSNNFKNGEWVILTSYLTSTFSSLSIRHFIPLFFLLYFISLPLWFFVFKLFLLPFVLYLSLLLYASVKIAIKEKSLAVMFYSLAGFMLLHLSYGLGSIAGIFKLFSTKK